MQLTRFGRYSFTLCVLYALTALPAAAQAEGLRAKDILGITAGMTVEQVQAKMLAYNHNMIIQNIKTAATRETPAYTTLLQGDIPPESAGDPPQDEITVHFVQYSDGTERSDAVAHFVFPLPEDQRVPFQNFMDKIISKYGATSTINEVGANEARWVFNAKGVLVLDSWGGDVADYKRCSGIVPYITNSSTRAGLPIYAMNDCGDFLYVRLFPIDTEKEHATKLAGYYMMYVDQEQYLANITGIDLSSRHKRTAPTVKKEDLKETPKNTAGPRF